MPDDRSPHDGAGAPGGASGGAPDDGPGAAGGDGHRHHAECYACPIGGFFLTARTTSPETFDHLVNAASELVAAAKSAIEAAERAIEHQRTQRSSSGSGSPPGDPSGGTRVERIRLAD